MSAVPAAKEKIHLSSLAAVCLPETRVWGSSLSATVSIRGWSWVNSTLRRGCEQVYDGTASELPVATYYRDGTSLLDYARNRYYSSTLGRFMTADPYVNSAGLGDPGSWNRYAYAGNDPVNFNDPGGADRYMVIGGLCRVSGTGYGEDNPVQLVPCFNIILFSPSPHNGPGGGGNTSAVDPGIGAATGGLKTIYSEAFKDRAKCRAFFNALAAQLDPKLGITGQALMDEVAAAANDAAAKYVFNGAAANNPTADKIDATRFPGVDFSGTIGNLFQSSSGVLALSQFNGSAIWVNTSFFASQGTTSYALGVLMHELLHKLSVGGGFSHDVGMPAALNAAGAPVARLGQGEAVGSRIGQICF